MEFKTICILKYPKEVVWAAMRDEMTAIGDLISEIEYIRRESQSETAAGIQTIVTEWKAAIQFPDFIGQYVKPEMLTWTDTAEWHEAQDVCYWKIDSHYFKEKMESKGSTTFESAIGGKGCRLTFEGFLKWESNALPGFNLNDGIVGKTLEPIIKQMITGNFRKVADATEVFLKLPS